MENKNDNNARIKGKIIIRAMLENETPLLVASGRADIADKEQLLWPADEIQKPYIPASSIAGVIRSYFQRWGMKDPGYHFWGFEDDHPQSHIRFDDLVPDVIHGKNNIQRRDGVKISAREATAEDKKKYDYQIVEPGIQFPFLAEITLRESMDENSVLQLASDLCTIIQHKEFRIGAHTNTGFGRMKCLEQDLKAYHFKFPENEVEWYKYLEGNTSDAPLVARRPSQANSAFFSINAEFSLKNTLMIGSYGIRGDEPDKSQLRSRKKFALPGKSIRGALRHRALKICNLWGANTAQDLINNFFGMVDESGSNARAVKGRLRIEESIMPDVKAKTQDRIRVDRFTGGVIGGALFNSEPVWTTDRECIQISMTVTKEPESEKDKTEEIKLLLMLLKDLWLEDLAIGGEKNIGRGVLKGKKATICQNGQVIGTIERINEDGAFKIVPEDAIRAIQALILTKQPINTPTNGD